MEWNTDALLFIVLTSFLVSFCAVKLLQKKKKHGLPPGPKGLPFLGSLFELSMTAWIEFEKWGKEYGPIVYVKAAGQGMLVLNSRDAAVDLLDRRSNIYSDRPRWIVAGEILTGGLFLAIAKHSEIWRKLRRAGHEAMSKAASAKYREIQQKEALFLTEGLLRDPNNWQGELNRLSASTILSIVYDLPTTYTFDDPLVVKINDFMERVIAAGRPGAHLVEFFTWMKSIPRSVAKWKRDAEEGFTYFSELFEGLFHTVKKRISDGDERPSLASNLIQMTQNHGLSDKEAAWLCGTMYAAGAETTASVLSWFLLAMIVYPEKQKRCQEELDSIVGRSRMPAFQDMEHLPYIRATVREAVRWRTVAPLAVHYAMQDDWYQGYFIPKGTICFGNMWTINRDPAIYGRDADDFNPDRFMNEGGQLSPAARDTKDGHVAFGFGQRICLGRYMANQSLFISIACLLWAADINPKVDVDGNPIIPPTTCDNHAGIVRPLPFRCSITPRFPEAVAILQQTQELYT